MSWEAIGAVGELVNATAVVLSLVYLSLQIGQNTKASKAATMQDMTNKWVQINLWMAEDADRTFNMAELEPEVESFSRV